MRKIIISLHLDSFYDKEYWNNFKNLTEENKTNTINLLKIE